MISDAVVTVEHHPSLVERYQAIWAESRPRLLLNDIIPEPAPTAGSSRWGVSAVFQPKRLPSRLLETVRKLSLIEPEQFFYNRATLHFTLRTIENRRETAFCSSVISRSYKEALIEVAQKLPPFRIDIVGLAGTPSGIIARGLPSINIAAVRQRLHGLLAKSAFPLDGPERDAEHIRTTCHASVAVFSRFLSQPSTLVDFIDSTSATWLGAVEIDSITLVGYRGVPYEVELVPLAEVNLRG